MGPNGISPGKLQPGFFVIIELDARDYEQAPTTGADRVGPQRGRPARAGNARGAARENTQLIWRVVEILEILPATPTDNLKFRGAFWETYDHAADITERKYAPAYSNSRGQEMYISRKTRKTPSGWTAMEDHFPISSVISSTSFQLTKQQKLPRHAIMELLPLLSVHVVALPPCTHE